MAPRPANVVVLDYGFGNVRSAVNSLIRAGADAVVTADPRAAAAADGLVVPGVGAFAACMAGLRTIGGPEIIADRVAVGRPVLGICVGMQVMFSRGVEQGIDTPGLDLLDGVVERLEAPILPHMGWNTVTPAPDSLLFEGVAGERFYFVHSYGVRTTGEAPACISWSEHGDRFVAAVERGSLRATQFHPEKSGPAGALLLRNWLRDL